MLHLRMNKYVGKPYETYNCLDLVKEFYKDNFNIEVKNYYEGDTPDRRQVESLIISNRGDFVKVEDRPRFGDLVVIRLYGIECHIGVCVDRYHFLHSIKTIGSTLDKLEKYSKMIAGYYRHQDAK